MVFHYRDFYYQYDYFHLWFIFWFSLGLFNGCAPQPPILSPGHININNIYPTKEDIPPLIQQRPFVPPLPPTSLIETFTVVVDAVPVDKLLFALARDTRMNIDIHPGIHGNITLNAINQTLPQLLERIAKQVDLRYQINGRHLTITPDLPYMRLYKIGYVNMSRNSNSEVSVATEIAGTGQGISQSGVGGSSRSNSGISGGNNSSTKITNKSNNHFWETLENNLYSILVTHKTDEINIAKKSLKDNVIVNRESGIITIRATHKQHEEIQHFVDQVLTNIQRQVLIEATIVEVRLNNQYQAGINWQRIDGDFSYIQSLIGGNLTNAPFYSFGYSNPNSKFGNLSATVHLLEQFGSVKVLSSPKIMALNNQTAILKVVDNIVYFTTEVELNETETRTKETFTTEINTVPIGLVMSVTPQISDNDVVIINIRPTISRIIGTKADPNPVLAQAGTVNEIPEIQVREIESILKINNGDIAIIGGLMEDIVAQKKQGIPVLSQLPLIGDLFSYHDDEYTKTELVIFLRPVVIKDASLSGNLQDYQLYLPNLSQPNVLHDYRLNQKLVK